MELQIELDPDLPVVQADPVLIRRVLDNLLDNSAKYGKSLPVSIHATASTEVFVEVREKSLKMRMSNVKSDLNATHFK